MQQARPAAGVAARVDLKRPRGVAVPGRPQAAVRIGCDGRIPVVAGAFAQRHLVRPAAVAKRLQQDLALSLTESLPDDVQRAVAIHGEGGREVGSFAAGDLLGREPAAVFQAAGAQVPGSVRSLSVAVRCKRS
jgi:hypothetical protein